MNNGGVSDTKVPRHYVAGLPITRSHEVGAMAEFERSLIVERVKAGMRNARAKGKRIGRPPRTYLDQEERKAIAEAYRQGLGSLRQLAARFGTSVGMVQRCMRNL